MAIFESSLTYPKMHNYCKFGGDRGDKDIWGRVYHLKCKLTLKVKVNHAHSRKQPYLPQDAQLVQIW